MGRETVDIHGMSYKQMKFKYSSIEAHTTTEILLDVDCQWKIFGIS